MKSTIQILFAIILSFCTISAQTDLDSTTLVKVGMKMPSFTVNTIDGKAVSSSSLKGKVVLINFWATWCPPCRAEMPKIESDIHKKITDKNFIMLAISRKEEIQTVKDFLGKNNFTFPIYVDPDAKVYNLFASKYIPRNFVVGKDGKVKYASTGFIEAEFNAMVKMINEELKK